MLCNHIRNSTAFNSLQPTQINGLIQNLPAEARRINSLQEYLVNAQCDPVVNANYDVFIQNFSQGGGWDMWERMLQPQNNIFGAIGLAQEELIKQRSLEESASINEPKSGDGFLGVRNCLIDGIGGCVVRGGIRTPGSIVKEQIASIFDTNLKFYTTADAASLAVSLLTEFVVNKLFDSGLAAPDTDSSPSGVNFIASYKNEFCSADDNMSTDPAALYIFNNYPQAYAWFPPEEDINSGKATDDNDVGKSYCKNTYDVGDNRLPYIRCVEACHQAVKLSPGNDLIGPDHIGPNGTWVDSFSGVTPPPPGGGGGGGGGGTCSDQGGTANYQSNLRSALNAVITNNPDGIADQLNTRDNSFTFLGHVVQELQSAGFNATTAVLNGNGNSNSGDLIAVWQSGDSTIERYDAIIGVGDANRLLRNATQTDFTGDIPFSCIQ